MRLKMIDTISDKKILAVDDDDLSLFFIQDCLQQAGFCVEVAKSGEEAWNKLLEKPNQYSVVISDEMMSHMSGTKLMEKIKKEPSLKHLPIIILTQLKAIKNVLYAVNRGVFEYIIKPADPDELVDLVIDAIESSR